MCSTSSFFPSFSFSSSHCWSLFPPLYSSTNALSATKVSSVKNRKGSRPTDSSSAHISMDTYAYVLSFFLSLAQRWRTLSSIVNTKMLPTLMIPSSTTIDLERNESHGGRKYPNTGSFGPEVNQSGAACVAWFISTLTPLVRSSLSCCKLSHTPSSIIIAHSRLGVPLPFSIF